MSGKRELRFHGDFIEHIVMHGDAPKYVISLTWIRHDTYHVEVRRYRCLGPGTLLHEKGFTIESDAREHARTLVDICR